MDHGQHILTSTASEPAACAFLLKNEKKNEFAQILAKELEYMNQDFGVMATNGAMLAAFR